MDLKTLINSVGLILTIIGIIMVYKYSPLKYSGIKDDLSNHSDLEKKSNKKNNLMKWGVYIVVI